MLHAGSAKTGFWGGSKLTCRSRTSASEDYSSELNATIFKEWFYNQFVNVLEEGAVIVMENARYHSIQINKPPTTASTKSEIT
jgi:hypothetical protein